MAKNQSNQNSTPPRRTSKRQRRIKFIIYLMVIAMILSTLTYGLAMFI